MPETKILHVSDLHFGWGFDEPSWQNLCLIAENLRPDFLLVTGDLVNNPFFWEFSRAKQNLTNLKTRLEQKGASPELIVVPGNHDTRLFGLFPIRRLCPISIVFTAFALLLGLGSWLYLGWNPLFVWSEIILISLAAFVFTLWCLCGNFRKYFRDFLLPDPTVYNRGHVDIVFFTFDSATVGSAARGEISKDQLITAGSEPRAKAAKKALEDGSETRRDTLLPYGIALLHHHPLPIPYDTRHERLLVLQNAGAFLNEVSRLKIRLILHGHKHHRHFSRITINAGQDDEFEVGVLSTGTPTAGTKPPHFGYNFNFLQLDDNWDMRVTPYEGSGGTFKKLQPFIIENAGLAPKRVYESFLGQYEAECDLGVSVIEIDQDGDAYHKEEYRGFKIIKDGYTTDGLREPISVGVEPGHIELFSAGPLDDNCPLGLHLSIDTAESTLRHQKGQIKFGRSVSAEYRPFNFFFHYHALNAFAMSAHQYREMYKTDVCTPIESTTMYLKGTPFKEIVMILKFPAGFKILGKPELIIENATGTREDYLEQKFGENLFYSPQLNLAFFRISYPRVNLKYGIQWGLTDDPPPLGYPAASLAGETEEIAGKLLRMTIPTPLDDPLRSFLEKVEEGARSEFGLDDRSKDPLDVSILVYDKRRKILKVATANFALEDPRWWLELNYGDGIAGRAYKMNNSRRFAKSDAILHKSPCFYLPTNLIRISSPSEIEEDVVLSVPLRHPKEIRAVYGILTISSKRPSSKLADIKTEDFEAETKYKNFTDQISVIAFSAVLEYNSSSRKGSAV